MAGYTMECMICKIGNGIIHQEVTAIKLCNLLNTFEEENNELKQQREELFIRERNTKNEWRELKEENQQLRELLENGLEVSQVEIDEVKVKKKMTEKRLWYIMCYCDDKIEAEDKEEAYRIFCEKHHFKEEDAEWVSYGEVNEEEDD